ncbi:hypothetical protein LCGC14_2711320 [marine sediment metagenome]|uniref:dATP/dGTP diphosphohydrolase N-terminal domain-containing protein n=1 Tax=marine sediment metagenome TaxID=412755 RepID=A0A0F8ZCT3_9ZZZZ
MDEPKMEDSGERRTFSTGAVRDRGGFKPRPDLISPHANLREGAWLAKGAEKYGVRNYEKGIPISECVASLVRHIESYKLGDQSEDHAAAIRTNAGFILHYEEEIKAGRMDQAIDDMPHYATPKPGDTRINPKTGQRETYMKIVDPAVPGEDRTVESVVEIDDNGNVSRVDRRHFYIAGPMRRCRFFNFPAFDAAKKLGESLGYIITSPADMDRANGIDPTTWSPEYIDWYDQNGWIDLHPDHKHDEGWLRDIITRDTKAIIALEPKRGDGLALLSLWAASTGTQAERSLAIWCGLRLVDAGTFKEF